MHLSPAEHGSEAVLVRGILVLAQGFRARHLAERCLGCSRFRFCLRFQPRFMACQRPQPLMGLARCRMEVSKPKARNTYLARRRPDCSGEPVRSSCNVQGRTSHCCHLAWSLRARNCAVMFHVKHGSMGRLQTRRDASATVVSARAQIVPGVIFCVVTCTWFVPDYTNWSTLASSHSTHIRPSDSLRSSFTNRQARPVIA